MASSEFPLISIVTPVHNGSRYIAECMKSVSAQSYENLEHVIFDNASTDDTRVIVDNHAVTDPRTRLVRSDTFLPIIDNWNRALGPISPQSKYVTVLPASDTFSPDAIASMVKIALIHPRIGIVGSLRLKGPDIHCLGLPVGLTVFPGPEIARLFFSEKTFAVGPTGNLIRRDLIDRNIPFFSNRYLHADNAAFFNMLSQTDFGFVHKVLMFDRVHGDSVTARVANTSGTQFRDGLFMLDEYGPRYFSREELAVLRTRYLARYYRFLVRSAVMLKGRAFFDYHLKALREAGCSPDFGKISHAVMGELGRAVIRPHRVLRHLFLRVHGLS